MDFVTDFGSVVITFNLHFFINYIPSFFSTDIVITIMYKYAFLILFSRKILLVMCYVLFYHIYSTCNNGITPFTLKNTIILKKINLGVHVIYLRHWNVFTILAKILLPKYYFSNSCTRIHVIKIVSEFTIITGNDDKFFFFLFVLDIGTDAMTFMRGL